jgi:hypothetical protein
VASLLATASGKGDNVQRRQFLKTAGAGAATIGASLLGALLLARRNRRCRGAPTPNSSAARPACSASSTTGSAVVTAEPATTVTEYLTSTVGPMLKDASRKETERVELYTAAAELNQLAGWIAYDIGNADTGRTHLHEALRLAQDAGDDALEADMFAGMSHHAAFGAALPEASRDAAKPPSTSPSPLVELPSDPGWPLRAESAVMEAHGLALQRDTSRCIAALTEAERAFDRFSTGSGPEWLNNFDDSYLAAKFAHTFRDLGYPFEAERFARRSLEMTDGYDRGRLFNTALLASTLADQGRVDEACAAASTAVRMTDTARSVRSGAYLADVGRRLAPDSNDSRVKALYEQMGRAGVPTPAV